MRAGGIFRRRSADQDFAAELESHLQMYIDDNLRAGMTRKEARQQALLKLGGLGQAKEVYRDRLPPSSPIAAYKPFTGGFPHLGLNQSPLASGRLIKD